MTPKDRPKRQRGRPSVGEQGSGNEVFNFIVPTADMDRVRAAVERATLGATLAGWMRAAIREKLERDEGRS